MELQIQDLVSSIKKDGIDSANREAAAIVAEAKRQADAIIADAKKDSDKLREDAKAEVEVFKSSAELSVQQAKRDAVLAFRQESVVHGRFALGLQHGQTGDQIVIGSHVTPPYRCISRKKGISISASACSEQSK